MRTIICETRTWVASIRKQLDEQEARVKAICKFCGQRVIHAPLKPGTMVESFLYGERKVGPVASVAVVRAYADQYRTFVGERVAFIDLKSGALCFRERTDLLVVHGFVHVDRPSTIITREKF